MTSRTVPVAGDRVYKAALKSLAEERGEPMSEMVRRALDLAYGVELAEHVSFFASRVTQITQSCDKSENAELVSE
jgi:hypothetical protein